MAKVKIKSDIAITISANNIIDKNKQVVKGQDGKVINVKPNWHTKPLEIKKGIQMIPEEALELTMVKSLIQNGKIVVVSIEF